MVEGLAELLRRINFVMQRAAGCLLDRGAPVFQRLLQRMRGGHPVRQLELEGLFLGERRAADQAGERAPRRRRSEFSWNSSLGWVLVSLPTFLIFSRMSWTL